MRGLLLKDLYNLGNQWKYLLFVAAIFCFSFANSAEGTISVMVTFLTVVLLLNSLAQDEMDQWYLLAKTLPVTGKQILLAKYIFGVLLVFCGALGGGVLTILTSLVAHGELTPVGTIVEVTAVASGAILATIGLLIPVNLKFGVQRARYVLFGLVIIPIGFQFIAERLQLSLEWIEKLMEAPAILEGGSLVAGLLLLGISFLVSVRILDNKEF